MSDSIAGAYFEALKISQRIVEAFEKEFGHPPTEVNHAIAASIFIEKNRAGVKSGGNGAQKPRTSQQAGGVTECPKCQGGIYDNRKKNRERAQNGEKLMPDFVCKDKDGCGWKQWPPKDKDPAKPVKQPSGRPSWEDEVEDQESSLPF